MTPRRTFQIFLWLVCAALPCHAQEPKDLSDDTALVRPLDRSQLDHPPFDGKFVLRSSDQTIVFLGGTSMADRQAHGYLETILALAYSDTSVRFRNLGWEADTVYRQQRPRFFYASERFERGIQDQRDLVPADIVFVEFGQMESLEGLGRLDDFEAAYARILEEVHKRTAQVVILSPAPFLPVGPAAELAERRNEILRHYVERIRTLAIRFDCLLVNQFNEFASTGAEKVPALSTNGIRWTSYGHWRSALHIADQLGATARLPTGFDDAQQRFETDLAETIRREILAKNRFWFQYFRPTNWAFLYGNRQDSESSWDPEKKERWFPEEVQQLPELVHHAELRIRSLVSGDNSIESEQALFRLHKDYEIHAFADEQDGIANPIATQWDARGRLWVLCTLAYAQLKPGEAPNDELVILEDTNRDGHVDKTTVFADGLNMPTGFALGDGGAYVGQGPTLLHLPDNDGDDRADGVRVVYSGFGIDDTHQNINSFTWSPGGDLMFCQGMHTFSRVETPWGISRADWSAVWRLRTDTLRLDPYLSPNLSSDNSWGITFGRWGEMYLKGNDRQLYDASPAMVPTTNRLKMESVYGLMGRTASKSMGIERVETAHLPPDMQGTFLVAGYFDRSIEHFKPYREGSGIKCQRLPKFLQCDHPSFRPLEVTIGPDGAIYVVDWFNPIISHYQASLRHPLRDKLHGRIWRITAKGRSLVRPPELSSAEACVGDLLSSLQHSESWVRRQAKRRLTDLDSDVVLPALRQSITAADLAGQDLDHLLYEAIGVYESHNTVDAKLLSRLLLSPEPYARSYATRVVGRWADRLPNAIAMLETSVADSHPRVRMEAVTALSHIRSPRSIVVAMRALDQLVDPPTRFSLTQAVHALAPHWLPALRQGQLGFDSPDHAAYVFSVYDTTDVAPAIRELIDSQQLPQLAVENLLLHLARLGTAREIDFVLERSELFPEIIDEVVERTRNLALQRDSTKKLIVKLMHSGNMVIRAGAIRLAGIAEMNEQSLPLQEIALDPAELQTVRTAAVRALSTLHEASSLTTLEALSTSDETGVKTAATIALCWRDLETGARRVAEMVARSSSQQELQSLLEPIFSRADGPAALATALESLALKPDIAKRIAGEMHHRGRSDEALQKLLARSSGTDRGKVEYSHELVQQLLASADKVGDAAQGAVIFRSEFASCGSCHRVGALGGSIGPDLTNVARGLSPELIVESILWPNRHIKEGYVATAVLTNDGRVRHGYLVNSSNTDTLVLKDSRTSELTYIAADDVESQQQSLSLMPEGLTRLMTADQLHHLLAFLLDSNRP